MAVEDFAPVAAATFLETEVASRHIFEHRLAIGITGHQQRDLAIERTVARGLERIRPGAHDLLHTDVTGEHGVECQVTGIARCGANTGANCNRRRRDDRQPDATSKQFDHGIARRRAISQRRRHEVDGKAAIAASHADAVIDAHHDIADRIARNVKYATRHGAIGHSDAKRVEATVRQHAGELDAATRSVGITNRHPFTSIRVESIQRREAGGD